MNVRTDLAVEKCLEANLTEGIWQKETREENVSIHKVQIKTEEAARKIGKAVGEYITLSDENLCLPDYDEEDRLRLSRIFSRNIKPMLPKDGPVLIVGLGNRHMTADSLGSLTAEKMLVTRHMPFEHPFRSVCAAAPGVLGITGIETAEMIKGIVSRVQPACVVAVDALCARESRRICTTVQITDTGISPGSGVGNHRMALSRDTLGVPVLAVGVPMVVYASVIVRDALSFLVGNLKIDCKEETLLKMTQKAAGKTDMVVTPREVDDLVGRIGSILALGLNMALQENLSEEEILFLTHDHP